MEGLWWSHLRFLLRMDGKFTWRQYWNYLRRQLYVMDTYCNAANRKLNHTMMVVHPLLSLAFVLPSTIGKQHILPNKTFVPLHSVGSLACKPATAH